MTFATEKEKQASERFMLIRFDARIDVTDVMTLNTPPTPNTFPAHKMPTRVWDERISGFDTLYQEVTIVSYVNGIVSCGQSVGSTGKFWADFTEYVTGNVTRYEQTTPGVSGDVVEWKPLIARYPLLSYSNDDIVSGIISITASTITLINENNYFGKYIAGNASLYNRELKIWLAINDASTSTLIFSGIMGAVSLSNGEISIQALDGLANLNKTAGFKEGVGAITAAEFMNPLTSRSITPKDVGKVIPRHIARRTTYDFGTQIGTISEPRNFYQGVCISYSPTINTTNNRTWLCGLIKHNENNLVSSTSLAVQGFGSVVRTIADGLLRYFFVSSPANLYYNQTVQWSEGGARYGVIASVGSFIHIGLEYNLAVFVVGTNSGSTSSVFSTHPAFSAYFKSGVNTVNLIYGRDYTVSAFNEVVLTLVSNFEANFNTAEQFGTNKLDPNSDTLCYYFHLAGDLNHAAVLKEMIILAGLTPNDASFTAAASALNVDLCLSIPYFGDGNLSTYADYASKILESTSGYLAVNAANEVEYKLYSAPSATSASTLDDSIYSDQSLEVQYQDIYTQVVATNKHFKDDKLTSSASLGTEKSKITSDTISGFLHGIKRTKFIEFVTENLTNTIDRIFQLNSNRRAKIKLTTATKNLDSELGDDVRIVSGYLPGNAGTTDFKIVSKTVNGKTTEIEALDLYGVT